MRLDIVFPAHNEQDRIGRTLDAYSQTCADAEVRFLVALDSCSDRTADVVRRHRARDGRVELIEYPRLGKGGVIAETFGRSDAELVGFVDADGATPPDEMLRLARTATHTDGAIASRRHPAAVLPARRPLSRQITSAGFAAVVRRVMRLPYADTQCGAKVLRRGSSTTCCRGCRRATCSSTSTCSPRRASAAGGSSRSPPCGSTRRARGCGRSRTRGAWASR
jgi:glycosyltransferase involved in cell wall biosynthesis